VLIREQAVVDLRSDGRRVAEVAEAIGEGPPLRLGEQMQARDGERRAAEREPVQDPQRLDEGHAARRAGKGVQCVAVVGRDQRRTLAHRECGEVLFGQQAAVGLDVAHDRASKRAPIEDVRAGGGDRAEALRQVRLHEPIARLEAGGGMQRCAVGLQIQTP